MLPRLVVVLPQRDARPLADGVVLDHSAVHQAAGVPGLGDAPVAVLVVLRPPEQLGPGHAHLLDDVARDHEPAPRPPLPHRPVGLHGPGEAERRLGVVAGLTQQGLEALGVGHDVVVEHPGEVVGPGQQFLEGERPSSGGAEVGVRPHHRDGQRGPEGVGAHGRIAGVVHHHHRCGPHRLGLDGVQAAGQGLGGVVGQDERHRAGPEVRRVGEGGRGLGLDVRGEFAPAVGRRRIGPRRIGPRRRGLLADLAQVAMVDAEPAPGPVEHASDRGHALGSAVGELEAAQGIEKMPREPARPAVASRQCEIVAGEVVRPPRLVGVVGPMAEQRVVAAGQGLAVRHLTGTDHVHQDREPGGAQAAVEVEVLETEEERGVGQDPGLDHGARHEGRPPRRHVHGAQLAGQAAPGYDIDGVPGTGDEDPAEGDHGSHPVLAARLDPGQQPGHPRCRQVQEHHVVLAQVGPSRGGIGERLEQAAPKSTGGADVRGQAHHAHALLELGVVEPSLAVDHHDDALGREALDIEQ